MSRDVNKNIDNRAKFKPLGGVGGIERLFGSATNESNILQPLARVGALVLPYRPSIIYGNMSNYGEHHFPHTNYPYPYWTNSQPDQILIESKFTANTDLEARYMLAAIHFFRSITKGRFGEQDPNRGAPPPVVAFDYCGPYMFNMTPVVVTVFRSTMEPDIDYVPVEVPIDNSFTLNDDFTPTEDVVSNSGRTRYAWVPTITQFTVEVKVHPQPRAVRREFNYDAFRSGELVRNNRRGTRGLI